MRQSIEMAMGAAMERIAQSDVVKSHVGGKIGTAMKTSMAGMFMAAAMLAGVAPAAHAENCLTAGGVLGALVGGVVGHQIGGGTGKTIATAAGAVVGCGVGDTVQRNSEYRQQQQAGYQGQGAQQAPSYGGQFAPPVVGVSPMGNYMAHTFSQINGREAPQQPLTAQGQMAMEKVLAQAEQASRYNVDAQQDYARSYENVRQAQLNAQNPEAQVLMGNQINQVNYQLQNALNQASQRRNQSNMQFGSTGMKMADLVEFEAARGYDITPYAQRIMNVMKTPMSATVSGFDPSTRQNVSFSTGVGVAPVTYQRAHGY